MTTFARQAFNSGSYAAIRPTYPRTLYDAVYQYARDAGGGRGRGRALDLGCGTGQATTELAGTFGEVIGVDPSAVMLAKARGHEHAGVRYVESRAEDLAFVADASVDLVISAQAAHWFDYARLWRELARVLRPGGTVAFWGYSQFRIAGHGALTPLIAAYAQGRDPARSLGPHWEQPGRRILDNHLRDVPRAPEGQFMDHEYIFWTGEYYAALPGARPIILRKEVTWEGLQAYLRTFSSLYRFHEVYPEDAAQRTGLAERPAAGAEKEGDIVERFWWELKEEVARAREDGEAGAGAGAGVEIEWPMAMLLCRRTLSEG